MTDLIAHLIAQDRRVISFPIREYWVDIGHRDDYERALIDAGNAGGGKP
jgi:NDP-sugar pyrophosphorylase family protein